jgi:L-lysine exporter family protein LysE/ArgO
MITVFGSGMLLGLALIIPIGAQNIFVLNQSMAVGMPRALTTVAIAGLCDSLLIIAGALGVSGVLVSVPGLRPVLLTVGVVLLLHLGTRALRAEMVADTGHEGQRLPLRTMVSRTASVSLLNPHAILDTVGVLGAAIAAQQVGQRIAFAFGTVTASWVWFLILALATSLLRRFLTPRRRQWIDRISGAMLLTFAIMLAVELVNELL